MAKDDATDDLQDDVVKTAQKLFQRDKSNWSEVYESARDDLHFLSDDPCAQWNVSDYNARVETGRPALTIDQLSQFVHQVANDIRQNTPSINIIPDGRSADIETADIFKGLIRDIEYKSAADDVYDTAATSAIKCSIGFIRIDHDYADDEGFDQELLIKRVINPLACWIDSNSIECDGRDAKHGFVLDEITVAEFKKRWPDKLVCSFDDAANKAQVERKDDDYVTIAEFFQLVEEERWIAATDDGQLVDYQEGAQVKTKRKVKKTKVKRYFLSGKETLEETTFPGKYIPLVPVYGEEAWQEGKRHLFSLIRKSKSAQQMFNFWKSLETELLMKQPRAPVMAAFGAVEDFAADWINPDKSMLLRYKLVDAQGNPIPKPERLPPPQIPTGIVNAARETVDDIKATMGMYNASLGQKSNEQSGVAIARRQQEGDVATFHFSDNLTRSITQVGRILVSAIPEIYDTPRIIRIIGLEDEPDEVGINGQIVEGQERDFDLTTGKYDVRVITGASYTTKRQEAAEFFTEVVSRQPELMSIMGDLLFSNMDFAGAQAMAERMKKVIDPKFLSDEDRQELEPAVDPEKQQMAQVIQEGAVQLQQMQQDIAALEQQLKNKDGELQVKAMSATSQHDIDIKKLELQQQQQALDAEIKLAELALKQRELEFRERDAAAKLEVQREANEAQQISDALTQVNDAMEPNEIEA